MKEGEAKTILLIARCLVFGGLAACLPALCQQPQSRSDQPEKPGHCVNNSLASDCNLDQTNLKGPVHTVEIWMDRDTQPIFHSGHGIQEYSPEGLLIESGSIDQGRTSWNKKYIYDSEGHRIEIGTDDEAGVPRVPTHTTEKRTYDTNGRLLSEDSSTDTGSSVFHEEWTYSAAGLLITDESTYVSHSGGGTQHSYQHTAYRYDADGRLIEQKEEDRLGQIGKDLRYEYPAPGRKRTLDFSTYCRADNVPPTEPSVTIDDTYDTAGRLLDEAVTAPGHLDGCGPPPPPPQTQYMYDGEGRLIGQLTRGPAGQLISRETMTYDSHGNRTKSTTEELSTREPKQNVSTSEYVYDSHGNWTRFTEHSATYRATTYRVLTYY